MNSRTNLTVLLSCVLLALTSCSTKEVPTRQEGVTLTLSQVSVERIDKDLLFICNAVIDNGTGAELSVKSNFFSAFDGLELIVMDETGDKLAQQPFVYHQSPFSWVPRSFALNEGKNLLEMRFPVSGLPENQRKLRVQLVGQLPGSGYAARIASDQVNASMKFQRWPWALAASVSALLVLLLLGRWRYKKFRANLVN